MFGAPGLECAVMSQQQVYGDRGSGGHEHELSHERRQRDAKDKLHTKQDLAWWSPTSYCKIESHVQNKGINKIFLF